jgi:hypothetical protein
MSTQDHDFLHAAINEKLSGLVAPAAVPPPAWYEAWLSLGPQSDEIQRLKVYQAIRNAGIFHADAGFYLVSWQIDAIVSQIAEESLHALDERLTAVKRKYGLEEDDFWPLGQTPEEYESLRREFQENWDKIFVAKLQEFGEEEMARQYHSDPEGFQKRSEAGREFFHGPQDADDTEAPAWIYTLVEAVADRMTAMGAAGTIGFRYREEGDFADVVIYPRPVELIGGADDGEIVAPAFSLDLAALKGVFDCLTAYSWEAIGLPDGEGPHISLEGVYQRHEVVVRVLAYAPEDEEPGTKFDTTKGEE